MTANNNHKSNSVHTSPAPSASHRAISITNRSGVPKKSTRGSYVSSIGDPQIVLFESSLEKKVHRCTAAMRDTIGILEQQPVRYIDFSGRQTLHFCDLLVKTAKGEKIAVAVKPSKIAEKKDFLSLLALIASQTPKEFADRVVLITERDMSRDQIHNAELIHAVRLDPNEDDDATVRRRLDDTCASVTIGELAEQCGIGAAGFRAAVRLIAAGEINLVDPSARITPDSRIEAATGPGVRS